MRMIISVVFAVSLMLSATVSGTAQAPLRDPAARSVATLTAPPARCLRALDGKCTNPAVVEAARLRAIIIPTVRVSYYGTPAGTVGGPYIRFERFFQDNPQVFGLPTSIYSPGCCIIRTK
jgi:hypothetical protein